MPRPESDSAPVRRRRPSAKTVERREAQLVSMAMDLAEEQMLDGSASAQVITHYLKLGSMRERLERDRLRSENQLLKARVDQLAASARLEEVYAEAIKAMRSYQGQEPEDDDDD